ncbi:MAG: outer membrane beta-barrel protein [Nonlabens sp.]|uniref:outer membrane protein n=3 Tax=Nonlabens sp. TaxID=1888209 RepID=UPI00321996EC
MLKNLFLIVLIMNCFLSYGQKSNFSLEANFPYTFGDNFVDEGYNGAIDLGLKYRFASYDALDLGASLNVGAFYRDDSRFDGGPDVNGSAFLFQPRVYASFKIEGYERWYPMVGLGYSLFAFNINDENFAGANFQENTSDDGINLNLAVAYDIAQRWFLQLQYDYVRLSARDVRKTPYNQNVNILKLGIGYRF